MIHEQTEGQVMYDYNSSVIKGSELRSESIKELQAALDEISSDPRYSVRSTSVVAYASPEGGRDYNAKLSDERAASAQKAWKDVTGEAAPDNLEVRSIGQDWEGFQEAIENSDLQDKAPPSPYHPSGSSQCTSPKHPVSCIEPGLATRFIHDI